MSRPSVAVPPPMGGRIQPMPQMESKAPFYLVMASLLFEFGRPQSMIPGMKIVPFSTVVDVLIMLAVFLSGKLDFKNPQTKLWIPLLGLMVVHTPLAVNNFWAAMTLKAMGLSFFAYLGVTTYVNSFERWKTLISMWMWIHVLLSALGIVSGGTGVGGWLADENDFCMAINMVVPFAFFMMQASPKGISKTFYLVFLGVFILTVMTTLSRGGFIGLAATGAYCWLRSSKKTGAIVVLVIVVLFMVALAPDKYWDEIRSSFTEQEMDTGTGGDRLYIWGIGFEMFLGNPIIGVGQGNFPWAFEEYEAGRTHRDRSRAGRAAHSLYFTLIAEMGLAGIAIFVGMLYFSRKDIKTIETLVKLKQDDPAMEAQKHDIQWILFLARAMEGSMVGFLVSSVFISTLWYPSFWNMMAFIVALRNTAVSLLGSNGTERATGASTTSPRSAIAHPRLVPRMRPPRS